MVAIAAAVERFGRLDIMFNNVGVPTPRLGLTARGPHGRGLRAADGASTSAASSSAASTPSSSSRSRATAGVILNTGSVAGLVGWGGTVYGATKGAVHQLTRAVAIEGAPFGIRANAICPAGMPFTNFMAAGGMDRSQRRPGADRRAGRVVAPARPADHGRGLRRGRRVTWSPTGPPTSPGSCSRSTGGTWRE